MTNEFSASTKHSPTSTCRKESSPRQHARSLGENPSHDTQCRPVTVSAPFACNCANGKEFSCRLNTGPRWEGFRVFGTGEWTTSYVYAITNDSPNTRGRTIRAIFATVSALFAFDLANTNEFLVQKKRQRRIEKITVVRNTSRYTMSRVPRNTRR